jgi:hypothetical protein
MAQHNCQLLNWNVRGLNDGARKDAVSELVRDTRSTIVCLQETKLQLVDQNVVWCTVGAKFANTYAVLPADQTRGGILLAVNEDFFDLSNVHLSTHAITATIRMRADGSHGRSQLCTGLKGTHKNCSFFKGSEPSQCRIMTDGSSSGTSI